MSQQIVNNGTFDNDPSAEKIRLAFNKTNDNFTELYSYLTGTGKAQERIVAHIESGDSELVEVANSVNASAPIIKARNTTQIISFIDPYGGGLGAPNYYKKRQYILKKGEGTYGASGTPVLPTDFIILTPNIIGINEATTFDLGNIMGADIHTYVNGSGPYLVVGTTIFETTEGSYVFSGDDGLYGVGEIQTIPQNFIPFGDAPLTNAWEKIYNLSLVGIDTDGVDELTYIANAVITYGAFTCAPDQRIVLRTTTPYNDGVIDRYYAVIPRVTTIGGSLGAVVYPSYFRPDGQSIYDTIPDDIIIELGDIGTTDIEDAFNVGDGGDPWDMSIKRFIRATYDGEVTLWSWQGEDGEFGGSGTPATADDFFLITGQPPLVVQQNNIVTIKTVLDTDLATLDGAGLATYYNAKTPAILKQGYESWVVHIVNGSSTILKSFLLVNRGKGLIGDGSPLTELGAGNFFEINVGGGTGTVESVTGDNDNVDNTDPNNPIILSKPLVTADTADEITLYPFGNFCNSFVANLEKAFVVSLTNPIAPAGETATVLCLTETGDTDFPTVEDEYGNPCEYVEGAPFEEDAYYDLCLWNNGSVTAYTYLRRSAPPIPTLTILTTSTSSTWSPNTVTNTGDTLVWNVTGSVTIVDEVADDPTLDLTGNTGDVIIKAKDVSFVTNLKLEGTTPGITYIYVNDMISLTELSVSFSSIAELIVFRLIELTKLTIYGDGVSLTSIDIRNNVLITELQLVNNNLTELDVTKNTLIEILRIDQNDITSIDLSENVNITVFSAEGNGLTSIDLSNNILLEEVSITSNSLTEIDLSLNIALTEISVSSNNLTTLDISNNVDLTLLDCANNSITGTDLDQILIDLNDNLFDGTVYIDIGRTSESDAAKIAIIGRGGTVDES